MSDFYISLPSNSSLQFYPDNTMSRFKVHLPQSIELQGQWLCGLAEIHFPNNLSPLIEGSIIVSGFRHKKSTAAAATIPLLETFPFDAKALQQGFIIKTERPSIISPAEVSDQQNLDKREKVVFSKHILSTENQASVISSAESFIQLLNSALKDSNAFGGQLAARNYPIEFKVLQKGFEILIRDEDLMLTLSPQICRILGFSAHDRIFFSFKGKGAFQYPFQSLDLEANKVRSFHIYCDIIAPRFVGDRLVPSLRSVPIPIKGDPSPNEIVSTHYDAIHYMPVSVRHFSDIEIELRDNSGNLLPFTYGITIPVLHFKQVQ